MGISGIWADCYAGKPSRNIFAKAGRPTKVLKMFPLILRREKVKLLREREKDEMMKEKAGLNMMEAFLFNY